MKTITAWRGNDKLELTAEDSQHLWPELKCQVPSSPKLHAMAANGYTALQFGDAPKQSIFSIITGINKLAQASQAGPFLNSGYTFLGDMQAAIDMLHGAPIGDADKANVLKLLGNLDRKKAELMALL